MKASRARQIQSGLALLGEVIEELEDAESLGRKETSIKSVLADLRQIGDLLWEQWPELDWPEIDKG